MTAKISNKRRHSSAFARRLILVSFLALVGSFTAYAQNGSVYFNPGNLVVSRSVYDNNPGTSGGGDPAPAELPTTMAAAGPRHRSIRRYLSHVFNNDSVDASFGITSKIFLDQITPAGALLTSLEVPNSSQNGVPPTKDQMVTSFSSKSELALNLSSDHSYLTFMGYLAPIDALDVSNANTPARR